MTVGGYVLTGQFEAIDYYDGQGWFAKGWAFDDQRPDQPVALELWSQNGLLVRFTADQPRPDLLSAGVGTGRCAFELQLPGPVLDSAPHMLHVIATDHRKALSSSPRVFAMPRLRGRLERVHGLHLEGWAKDELDPDRPLVLDLLVDGQRFGQIECSAFRRDLPRTLGTSGYNAFQYVLPSSLCDGQPHEVALRFTNTDILLPGCPVALNLAPEVVSAALVKLDADIERLERRVQEARVTRQRVPLRLLHDRNRYRRWLSRHEAQWNERPPVGVADSAPIFSVVLDATSEPANVASLTELLSWSGKPWERLAAESGPPDSPIIPLRSVLLTEVATTLERARGTFVVLLPGHYRPHRALLKELHSVLESGDADAAYVDEDSVDESGERHSPHFKPDWDPDRFVATGYVGGVCCIRRACLLEVLGRSRRAEPSWQELVERTLLALPPERVCHIPSVLAHRTATVVEATAERAARFQVILDDADWPARVEPQANGVVRLHWPVSDPSPGVTLIIPTRDRVSLLRTCIDSIVERTHYRPYSILVVDNGSEKPESIAYLAELERRPEIRVLRRPGPFNFSALNNDAVAIADTPLVGLINNDIEVIEPGWLGEMVSHAIRPTVGAVGAKLLYPDGTIQHGGVVVGMYGAADNAQKGFTADEPGYFQSAVATQRVSAVTAACLVCRRDIYQAVGGLDAESFAVSFNDVDFCLKVRSRGLQIVWTPYALLYHHESASRGMDRSSQSSRCERKEADNLRNRWKTADIIDPFYSPHLGTHSVSHHDFRSGPNSAVPEIRCL